MPKSFININYPFKLSDQGHFVDLTSTDNDAIKADLMHLILTASGQRLYLPDFGTNLLKFIFEPEDGQTLNGIKEEITNVVKKYLPNLTINSINVDQSTESEYAAVVRIDYDISDGVFSQSDFVTIKI